MGEKKKSDVFFEALNMDSVYSYSTQENIGRWIKNVSQEYIMEKVSYELGTEHRNSLTDTDINVAYIVAKVGVVTVSQLVKAIELRFGKVSDSVLPIPGTQSVEAILTRLYSCGVVGKQKIRKNNRYTMFYFVTNIGRKFINRALEDKSLNDYDFVEMKSSRIIIAEYACSYIALKLVSMGYDLEQRRIRKISHGVSRFSAICKKDNEEIAIDYLYFIRNKGTTSENEYTENVREKVQKIYDFLRFNENSRVILACNNVKDIKEFFCALDNMDMSKYYELTKKIFFTSPNCINLIENFSDALISFKAEESSEGLKLSDEFFDFEKGD